MLNLLQTFYKKVQKERELQDKSISDSTKVTNREFVYLLIA